MNIEQDLRDARAHLLSCEREYEEAERACRMAEARVRHRRDDVVRARARIAFLREQQPVQS